MRKLEEHFCNYEQAERIIDLGYVQNFIVLRESLDEAAPTHAGVLRSQALDFFRDEGIYFHIGGYSSKGYWFGCYRNNEGYCSPNFKLYHEAESALIDKLIEIQM